LLIWRVLLLIILFAFGLPGLVLSFPVFVVAENISKKKAAQAKASLFLHLIFFFFSFSFLSLFLINKTFRFKH